MWSINIMIFVTEKLHFTIINSADWATNNSCIFYTFSVHLFDRNWCLCWWKDGMAMGFFMVGHNASHVYRCIFRNINDTVGWTSMMNEHSLRSIAKMRKVWKPEILITDHQKQNCNSLQRETREPMWAGIIRPHEKGSSKPGRFPPEKRTSRCSSLTPEGM